jgi:hypothetical protein
MKHHVVRFGHGAGAAVIVAVISAFSVACGGANASSKPPEETAPTSSKPDEPASSSARKFEGPAAASSSDDVKKGIAALKGGDVNGAKAAFEVATQKTRSRRTLTTTSGWSTTRPA